MEKVQEKVLKYVEECKCNSVDPLKYLIQFFNHYNVYIDDVGDVWG